MIYIVSLPEDKQAESCFITTLERNQTVYRQHEPINRILLTGGPTLSLPLKGGFGSASGLYHAPSPQQLGTKASLQGWTDLRSLHLLNNHVGDGFIGIIQSVGCSEHTVHDTYCSINHHLSKCQAICVSCVMVTPAALNPPVAVFLYDKSLNERKVPKFKLCLKQ